MVQKVCGVYRIYEGTSGMHTESLEDWVSSFPQKQAQAWIVRF